MPEIALSNPATHQGYAEIQIYTLDGASGDLLTRSPRGRRIGLQSVLVMLNFRRTDLDEPEDGVSTELIPAACQFPGDVPVDDRGAGKF